MDYSELKFTHVVMCHLDVLSPQDGGLDGVHFWINLFVCVGSQFGPVAPEQTMAAEVDNEIRSSDDRWSPMFTLFDFLSLAA